MRILVYGAGVLGSNLASNLCKAKKDVTILARGKWAENIKKNGLKVKNKMGFGTKTCRMPVMTSLEPDDIYSVTFVALRYTQLDDIIHILRSNGTKNIVFVGNNVRARYYRDQLPDKNVMFSFAISAGHRESDKVVGIDLKKITIGPIKDDPHQEDIIDAIFHGTGYKVVYEPNMEDYLLCHAAFITPAAMAVYYTDGDLGRIKRDKEYINTLIDANIEGYRAIEKGGHEIIPKSDVDYESAGYRRTCLIFFKLMCSTFIGKICASDHAMNAIDEMSALNRDLKKYFDETGIEYPKWKMVEKSAGKYLIG